MKAKTTDITSLVSGVKVVGSGDQKKVMVVANTKSVKDFNASVVAASEVRHTKRWMEQRDIDNAVKNYVRFVADFHGKRLAGIEVIAATDKPDLFRTANGRFLKI